MKVCLIAALGSMVDCDLIGYNRTLNNVRSHINYRFEKRSQNFACQIAAHLMKDPAFDPRLLRTLVKQTGRVANRGERRTRQKFKAAARTVYNLT